MRTNRRGLGWDCRWACVGFTILAGVLPSLAPPNTPPTISDIPDQRTFPHLPSRTIPFLIGDAQTPATDLVLTGLSSNTNLVPATNIVLGGSSSNRTVTVTPREWLQGTATITVTVRDSQGGTASDSFLLTVAGLTDIGAPVPGLRAGSVAWGDYDNDGDLDILQTGKDSNGVPVTVIYQNISGSFSNIQAGLAAVYGGEAKWGDYDNDGDLDVLLSGYTTNDHLVRLIYRNDGGNVFTPLPPLLDIVDSGHGRKDLSVAWGDYDNDGGLDALFTGYFTTIYRNDGAAGFTDSGLAFPPFSFSAAAWGDADNDGRLDFVAMGTESLTNFMRLYHNDGPAGFSATGAGLPPVTQGGLAWGDYDGDGKLDLVFTGSDTNSLPTSGVLHNDGGNTFSSAFGPTIASEKFGSVAWGDYNNDGKLDFAIVNGNFTMVYHNLGGGSFDGDGLPGGIDSYLAWGDFDNDGDIDLLQMSWSTDGYGTKIFRNDGAMPNALPTSPTNLGVTVLGRSAVFSWSAAIDTDQVTALSYNLRLGSSPGGANVVGPMANLATGQRRLPAIGNAGFRQSLTITNLAFGTYYWSVQAIDNAFAGSPFAAEKSFRINSPPSISDVPEQRRPLRGSNAPVAFVIGDLETPASALVVTANSSDTNFLPNANLILSGSGSNRALTVIPAKNVGGTVQITLTVTDADGAAASDTFPFTFTDFSDLGLTLPGYTTQPSLAWGDIDNDGDLDFYVCGNDGTDAFNTGGRLVRNDGNGIFTVIANTLPASQQGDMAFGDFDNDGDLDVVMQGGKFSGVQVWRNNGNSTFSYVFGSEFLYEAAVAWGDFDNDGRVDFAAGGWNSSTMFTRLFQNAGSGVFYNVLTLPGVVFGHLSWGDYDNDGDLDLALVGFRDLSTYFCAVYRNDNGTLTDSGITFPAGWYACDWGDCNNDGRLDLLFSRHDVYGSNQLTVVYTNNASGLVDSGVRLPGIVNGSLQWGDYDNDGWLDILMTGASPALGTNITRVYRNNHDGTFTDIHAVLPAISNGRAAWGDYDNDGDLDILVTGMADGLGLITRVYRNDINVSNSPPTSPASLLAQVTTNTVRLSWQAATDVNQTAGLSYNVRVGRSPGAGDVLSPLADASTGRRRLPARGNADLSRIWRLKQLAPGTYYWSVQAIDHGFASSPFAAEQSFVITQPPTISNIPDQYLNVTFSSGAVPFSIGDAETPTDNLQLTAQSLDTNLVNAQTGIVFGGSGTNRTITITPSPDQLGSATITVTVTDAEGWSTSRVFFVNVFNSSPVISDITNQTLLPNSSTPPLPFTIGDVETPASNLVLTASSSNTNLVPVQNIVFGGAGSNRTVSVTLAANQVGNATITLTVADPHGGTASDSFVVEVLEFVETPSSLPALDYSAVAWGDYDNDGRLDILISGYASSVSVTRIYHNDGNGNFTDIGAGLPGATTGSVAWGDFDNDGWLDFVLTGGLTRIYRNHGDGTFTDIQAGLPSVSSSTAVWLDFDNDGLLDLLISGSSPTGYVSSVYRNNGNGTFADVNEGLPGLTLSAAACADFDRDGKVDILLAGVLQNGIQTARIYRNQGNGVFTDINAVLIPVAGGSAAWGDYDNDGWPDVLLTGRASGGGDSRVYRNNHDSTFTQLAAYLPSIYSGFSAWGDYDNDGKLDTLSCGDTYSGFRSAVYRGNADGTFNDINDPFGVVGAYGAAGGWGDFDGDGRLDVLLSGIFATRLFRNVTPTTNTPPAAPTGLSVALSNRSVTFNWVPPADNQSPSNFLSYNLRVGTDPGGEDVVSPSASPSGLRRMVRFGAAGQTNSWTLEDPPVSGTYYWSVQAIDGSFAGSPFAAEKSFTAAFVPSAYTLRASSVSSNFATLNGIASAKGASAAAWFEWGTTTNFGNVAGFGPLASNAVHLAVSAALTNLNPETNYYFRLTVSNSRGVTHGATMAFYSGTPPSLAPLSPISVTATQATLQAQVLPNRSPAYAWIEYGQTTNYNFTTLPAYAGSGTNAFAFSQTVTGLTGFTMYHCRVVATNEYGLRLGPDATFTTTAEPGVATLNATATNFTSATFAATVNPNGLATTVYFEYGTTTNYGNFTAFTDVGSARANLAITQAVSGLQPGTLYNFRVVAVNASATSFGGNRAVRTLSPFTDATLRLPPMLFNGAIAWGDYNNDGRLDLVVAGQTNLSTSFAPITRIYRNDGTNLTELNVGIPGLRYGAVAWGDFNNDGRLDLLVSGATNSVPTTAGLICRVYRNDGNDIFTDIGAGLPGVFNSAVVWADFNNDGRLDFIFAGSTNSSTSFPPISRVYLNNGQGGFTNANVALPRLQFGAIACADYNNDGRVDILMAGATNSSTSTYPICAVFRNNGNGTFSNANVGLLGVRDAAVAWGDFDDDGDLDILVTGNTNVTASSTTTTPITRVYRNNGNGTFSDINAGLAGVYRGAAAWGDYDSDGKLDLLIAGEGTNSQTYLDVIYRNAGNGAFESFSNGIPGTTFSSAAWGDYNNDGRLDVFIAGQKLTSPGGTAAIYRNLLPATNSPPTPPTAPQSISSANAATFRWDAASDNATATNGLTYNLRVGTMPGGAQIFSPAAAADGARRLAAMGNVGQRKIWTLTNLPSSGTFYWAVQAIDHSFAGSPFTAEQMFVVPGAPSITLSGVTSLNTNSATLNGFVDANGFDTTGYFEWGVTTNYGRTTALASFASNAAYASISATLTGLTSVTVYYWRLVATNSAGVTMSADQAFLLPDAPLLVSQLVTDITASKATLAAQVNPRSSATLAFFEWGLTPNYGNTTVTTNLGSGTNTVLVNASLANLPAGTICYYRSVASNGVGAVFGADAFFRTVPPPAFAYFATQPNGAFQVQFSGASNLTYEVQASTNLSNWTALGNAASSTNGLYLYLDFEATNYPSRFYRIRSP